MGNALVSGLIREGAAGGDISVIEPDPEKRERMNREYRVDARAEIDALDCESVLLAVKPQQLREAASKLAPLLDGQLVISIAAGILCADLSKWLGNYGRIVRVMPNTPAQVSKGISALYAMPGVDETGRQAAESILAAVGSTIWLDDEAKMDAFTALCGSGPAYVFYFLEAMIAAAMEMGFTPNEAKRMALETFSGSIALASESPDDAEILRQKVTSKGGTTERALLEMEDRQVKQGIIRGILAARERSREMGMELGKTQC